jgi:NADH-quinone oxidoreductase subunit I
MLKKIFQQLKYLYLSFISLLIGMKVTIKNFFAPAITLNYPVKKKKMSANFRGMVDLKPEACVICYQCIKICPVAALDLTHKQVVVETKKKNEITKFTYNAELCCFCGLCDEICPTDAIFMNKMYEVSVFDHKQVLNVDLMNADKYKHVKPDYSFAEEVQRNDENTVGKVVKPVVAPAPAAAPAAATVQAVPKAVEPKTDSTDKPAS